MKSQPKCDFDGAVLSGRMPSFDGAVLSGRSTPSSGEHVCVKERVRWTSNGGRRKDRRER